MTAAVAPLLQGERLVALFCEEDGFNCPSPSSDIDIDEDDRNDERLRFEKGCRVAVEYIEAATLAVSEPSSPKLEPPAL